MEQILIVEDNKQILSAVSLFLQMNDFTTYTALNGQEALELLRMLEKTPDLILSDIMMPIMNGYDFYKHVSENQTWSYIPFIFLTAKSDPDDIRFGKMLGVDDYITKPFNEDDLLASIRGKIKRRKQYEDITATLATKISELKEEGTTLETSKISAIAENLFAFTVFWNDTKGPDFVQSYPRVTECPFPLKKIGVQLFDVSSGIFGMTGRWDQPEGAQIRVPSVNMDAYIYFDSHASAKMRGGVQAYMLGVIARKLHYLDSSQLRQVCKKYSAHIKSKKEWKIGDFWQECKAALLPSSSKV